MRILTEYNPETHHVTLRYGSPIRRLFRRTSKKISEIFDPGSYSDICGEAGEPGPHDLTRGAQLIEELARSRTVTASGEDYNFALALVAWTTFATRSEERPADPLPLALTALAYVTPIRLPTLDLPRASEVLDKHTPPEAWAVYEDIRHFDGLKNGAIPVVGTAYRMWQVLRGNPSPNGDFKKFVGVLEASTILYRLALESLAEMNKADLNKKGGRR
jgi:hypothetical protein